MREREKVVFPTNDNKGKIYGGNFHKSLDKKFPLILKGDFQTKTTTTVTGKCERKFQRIDFPSIPTLLLF